RYRCELSRIADRRARSVSPRAPTYRRAYRSQSRRDPGAAAYTRQCKNRSAERLIAAAPFRLARYSAALFRHAQRVHIGVQDRFLLFAFVHILLAQADDDPQGFDVEAVALGLRIDVANVLGDCLLLFFEAFDALDERLELLLGETTGRLIVL